VAVLLAMLVATVWYQNTTETETVSVEHPQLAEQMRAEDIKNLLMMIAISLIILGMVVIRSVMITHRTAGAVINISDKLEKIANGDYTATLRLRENDNIRALEDPFNKMVEALRRRAEDDHRSLTKLAKDIEENGNPVDAEMLRRIADAHGQLIEEG
jgi:nitrogen fixation/metabolism regulation signal transduction histidine kinase